MVSRHRRNPAGPGDISRTDISWADVTGPAGPEPATSHLVVGYDRHPTSRAALDVAIDMARRLHAHLHVMHILDLDDLPVDPDAGDFEDAVANAIRTERDAACAVLARTPGNWTYTCRNGDPAQLLAGAADDTGAVMVIIGASRGGMTALMERFLGESVSASLVRHAHHPVLVVPEHPIPAE